MLNHIALRYWTEFHFLVRPYLHSLADFSLILLGHFRQDFVHACRFTIWNLAILWQVIYLLYSYCMSFSVAAFSGWYFIYLSAISWQILETIFLAGKPHGSSMPWQKGCFSKTENPAAGVKILLRANDSAVRWYCNCGLTAGRTHSWYGAPLYSHIIMMT
jgi:hypothetical protein